MTKVSIEKIRRFLNRKFSQEPFEEEINMTWGEKHWKAVQFSYILPAQPTPDFNLLFAWECNKGGEKKYSNEVKERQHGMAFVHLPVPRCGTLEDVHSSSKYQADPQILCSNLVFWLFYWSLFLWQILKQVRLDCNTRRYFWCNEQWRFLSYPPSTGGNEECIRERLGEARGEALLSPLSPVNHTPGTG